MCALCFVLFSNMFSEFLQITIHACYIAPEAGFSNKDKDKLDSYMAERGFTRLLALEQEMLQLKEQLQSLRNEKSQNKPDEQTS